MVHRYQERACALPVYLAIFADIDPGYILNAVMATVNVFWSVITAVLYASLDFAFIRIATAVMTVAVYIPASLIAFYVFGTVCCCGHTTPLTRPHTAVALAVPCCYRCCHYRLQLHCRPSW